MGCLFELLNIIKGNKALGGVMSYNADAETTNELLCKTND